MSLEDCEYYLIVSFVVLACPQLVLDVSDQLVSVSVSSLFFAVLLSPVLDGFDQLY
jgi:hypothetical protein